nr:MAG TPA: hypothetical protein [Caudoviricetes sp.]
MIIFGIIVFTIYVIFGTTAVIDCYNYLKENHDYED